MRVAVTGAGGFLGLHVRAALLEAGAVAVPVALGERFDARAAVAAVDGADAVLHLAGVHRAPEDLVRDGNHLLATQLARTLLDAYFELEDPTTVRPIGIELKLEAQIGSLRLRGPPGRS